MLKYLIVGNSYSAVWAAEYIRKVDQKGEIIMVSAESYRPYAKALIQDYVSMRFTDFHIYYRTEDFYKNLNITPVFSNPVKEVNTKSKRLILNSGETLTYDKLYIATGGIPFVPPIEGIGESDNFFTFTTWDDAKRMKEKIDRGEVKKVVVIGAGLIGTQLSEALALRGGIEVTIVELAGQVLPRAVDELVGEWVEEEFLKEGIRVIKNNTVERVNSDKGLIKSVKLKTGEEIECDILAVAIGVRPNVSFLEGSGIQVDRGVLVDEYLRTNDEDVFAGGDVAQAPEILSGQKQVIPIIPLACEHGKIAGLNMAGKGRKFKGSLSQNSFHFGGLEIISAGVVQEDRECRVLMDVDADKRMYKKMILKGDFLQGYILTQDIENAGIYTALIKNRVPVGSFIDKIMDRGFHLHLLPKELRKNILEHPA